MIKYRRRIVVGLQQDENEKVNPKDSLGNTEEFLGGSLTFLETVRMTEPNIEEKEKESRDEDNRDPAPASDEFFHMGDISADLSAQLSRQGNTIVVTYEFVLRQM